MMLLEGDWIRRQLEGLEETSIGSGRCCWKGIGSVINWKGRQLDPDIVAGRGLDPSSIGRNVDWIRTLLLEGTSIGSFVDWKGIGSDVNWKGWIRRWLEGNWKGWIWTSIGRDVGSDVNWKGIGRDVGSGRCWLFWSMLVLLLVPINAIVVDCSDWRCCWLFRSMLLLIVAFDVVVALVLYNVAVVVIAVAVVIDNKYKK